MRISDWIQTCALPIFFAPLLSVAILATILYACWPGRGWAERILFLSLLAPLATVAIYRNAFPYHFAFILSPAAVAIAPAVGWLRRRCGVVAAASLPLAGQVLLSYNPDRDLLPRPRTIPPENTTIFSHPA